MFFLIMVFFCVVLCGCSTQKNVIDGDKFSEKSVLDGKTGFISVVSTSKSFEKIEKCKNTVGLLTLVKDSLDYDFQFYPNKVFAAVVPSGLYYVQYIKYVCEDYPLEKSKRGFSGYQQDGDPFYLMIPNEGFCKMDALTENGSLKLVPGKEKIVEKSLNENLTVSYSNVPDCQMYSLSSFYQTNERQTTKGNVLTSKDFSWKSFGTSTKLILKKNMAAAISFEKNSSELINVVAEMNSKKDFSTCSVLKYDYKGSQHVFFAISSLLGGTFMAKPILLNDASDWRTVSVSLNDTAVLYEDLNKEDFLKSVIGFAWRVKGYSSVGDYLEIENVRCE